MKIKKKLNTLLLNHIDESNNTPVIQENHKLIFHLISEILDQYY
tara:strand:+ start:558 stop:689 length:132 start_codon:yes stop_codon:yes gene_type:complete